MIVDDIFRKHIYNKPEISQGDVVVLVVRFTTTYVISAYQHCCEFEYRSGRGVQNYVIKYVSDLRQVGNYLRALRFPPPIKLTATM